MAVLSVGNIVTRLNHAFKDRLQNSALYQLFAELSPTPVNQTAATLAVTGALVNKTVTLNRAGGITVTLPPSTGTGDIYRFYVGTTFTGSGIIQVTTTDVIQGALGVTTDAAGVVIPTAASSDTNTITMNGSTTGGLVGSYIELQSVASGVWSVRGNLLSTGAEATPFSAA